MFGGLAIWPGSKNRDPLYQHLKEGRAQKAVAQGDRLSTAEHGAAGRNEEGLVEQGDRGFKRGKERNSRPLCGPMGLKEEMEQEGKKGLGWIAQEERW